MGDQFVSFLSTIVEFRDDREISWITIVIIYRVQIIVDRTSTGEIQECTNWAMSKLHSRSLSNTRIPLDSTITSTLGIPPIPNSQGNGPPFRRRSSNHSCDPVNPQYRLPGVPSNTDGSPSTSFARLTNEKAASSPTPP